MSKDKERPTIRWERIKNALKNIPTEYQVWKAKRAHRKEYPNCAVCGCKKSFWGRNLDVHHKIPVSVSPLLAASPDNLETMCRIHHWWIGHLKNWKTYNRNLEFVIADMKATVRLNSVKRSKE